VVYNLPKRPHMFTYVSLRGIKSPQNDPALSNQAIIQTAFSVGIGMKIGK
jgi:hypothetical protein